MFCEMLGGGVIRYPYPKFQFAGIALDKLLPCETQRGFALSATAYYTAITLKLFYVLLIFRSPL